MGGFDKTPRVTREFIIGHNNLPSPFLKVTSYKVKPMAFNDSGSLRGESPM